MHLDEWMHLDGWMDAFRLCYKGASCRNHKKMFKHAHFHGLHLNHCSYGYDFFMRFVLCDVYLICPLLRKCHAKFTGIPMSPKRSREQELEWWRQLLARGKMIDDAVFGWRDCMQELKEAENMFRETQSSHWEHKVNTYKSYAQTQLKVAADVIFAEANAAEHARMPPQSSPHLVMEWALQQVTSSCLAQRTRWGSVVGIHLPRMSPPPSDSAPPNSAH